MKKPFSFILVIILVQFASCHVTAKPGPGRTESDLNRTWDNLREDSIKSGLGPFRHYFDQLDDDSLAFAQTQASSLFRFVGAANNNKSELAITRKEENRYTSEERKDRDPRAPLRFEFEPYYRIFDRVIGPMDFSDARSHKRGITPSVAIVSFLPEEPAGYNIVFETEPTAAQEDEMADAASHLKMIDPQVQNMISSIDELREFLSKTAVPFIFIVGHNSGGDIITPDGSRISIAKAAVSCAKQLVLCFFVSCEAQSVLSAAPILGPRRVISIDDARTIVNKAAELIREAPRRGDDISDPFRVILDLRSLIENEARPRYIVLSARIGAMLLMVVLGGDDEDDE